MKHLHKLLFILIIGFFSCQENSEKIDFEEKSEIPESKQLDANTRAIVGSDNYPYSIDSFEELDEYFRSIEANKPENLTLKSHALTGLFVQGLLQNISDEEKLYYARAMANMSSALPNVTNFYDLMHSLNDKNHIQFDRLQSIAQKFYNRNLHTLESMTWENDKDIKNKKEIILQKIKDEFQLE